MAEENTEYYRNIRIEDIDRSIVSWFDVVVDAHVETPTNDRAKVPVVLSSGERWITAKQNRGIRDKNGKLILPIISIRRTNFNPAEGMSALGVNVPRLQVSKKISSKTNEVKNQIAERPISSRNLLDADVYEITSIPFPFHGLTTYELVIQTQYSQQMNAIIEKICSQLEYFDVPCFVARPQGDYDKFVKNENTTEYEASDEAPYESRKPLEGYYFVGFLDPNMDDESNFEEFTDQERIIKYSTTFRVPSYLQLDPEGKIPAIKREKTAFKLKLGDEDACFVDNIEELDIIFGYGK